MAILGYPRRGGGAEGGNPQKDGGYQPIFLANFPKNCMRMTKFDLRRKVGRETHVPKPPLVPPVVTVIVKHLVYAVDITFNCGVEIMAIPMVEFLRAFVL